MDPRVREHAETIVEYATDVSAGDEVVVFAPPTAEDLVVALNEAIAERDAMPFWGAQSRRPGRAMLLAADSDELGVPESVKAVVEASDVVVSVNAPVNGAELSDVPPEKIQLMSKIQQPITEATREKRWCLTAHPTPAGAQRAGMSTEAYEEFVYDAVNRDWSDQRAFQAQLVDVLDPADEVRVVSGDRTDVTMRVAGMDAANDDGGENLPGGEVFTAPVPDSVEGTVHFDLPVYRQGREIRDATLTFEDGEVVEYEAAHNEAVLASILGTDAGARRVGEFGVGMNRGIDRFTYNMLFDEKMDDTVHFALGRTLDETLPDGVEGNDSAVHVDMLVDVSEESYVEVDGEVVQRNGTFRFEDSEADRTE